VQGVGFRYYTVSCALDAEVRGWVRNLPDGRVEAEVVGEDGLLNDLVKQLKIGPPGSRVTSVEVKKLAEESKYNSFEIKYF